MERALLGRSGGIRRVCELIDRFGDAIEADLADRQIDLVDEWGQRRFRRILNLVDHLPRNSAYMQALTDDDEWAEQVLRMRSPQVTGTPSVALTEWSPEAERLTDVYDRLGELIQAVLAAAGAKPKRVRPAPRPRSAIDRANARQRKAKHDRLVARMLPRKAQDGSS